MIDQINSKTGFYLFLALMFGFAGWRWMILQIPENRTKGPMATEPNPPGPPGEPSPRKPAHGHQDAADFGGFDGGGGD